MVERPKPAGTVNAAAKNADAVTSIIMLRSILDDPPWVVINFLDGDYILRAAEFQLRTTDLDR